MPPTAWPGYEAAQVNIVVSLVKSCDICEDDLLQEAHTLLLCPHLPVHHHRENTLQPQSEKEREHNFLKIMAAMIDAEGNKYWQ